MLKILRVSQTWPTEEYPGKGLHAYYTSINSNGKVLF